MKIISSVRLYANHLLQSLVVTISLFAFTTVQAQDTKDYKFKLGITYNISTDDKTHNMKMWVSDNDYSAIEASEGGTGAFIIFNMKDKKMVTVMEAQKMAMIMDLNKYQQTIQQQAEDNKDAIAKTKIAKTGVKEKILGYNCDQYKITSDKSESLISITTELGAGFAGFAKSLMMMLNNGGSKGATIPDTQGAENGVMMKLEAKDTSTGKVTKLEATAVDKDGKEINISDYKVMSM